MPTTVEKLIAQEMRVATQIEAAYKRFFLLVDSEVDKIGGWTRLKTNKEKFRRFKNKLPRMMDKAGLNNVSFYVNQTLPKVENIALEELSEQLDKYLKPVDVRKARKATLKGTAKQNSLIMSDQRAYFNKKFTKEALDQISGENGFKQFIKSLTKQSQARIDTIVRTSVQVHDNLTVTNKAEELGLTKWRYAGANDSKNRPFCAKWVGKVTTDEEMTKQDNGVGGDPAIVLGFYNCRHRKEYLVE